MEILRKERMFVSGDNVDDGGSFESMVREAEEAADGDEALKLKLLTKRIIEEFVNKQIERASVLVRNQEQGATLRKHCVLGIYVPTRRRSGPCSKLQLPAATTTLNGPTKLTATTPNPILSRPPKAENKKSSQKRQFHQIQTQNHKKEEEQIIRQPDDQKKKRKTDKPKSEEIHDMPESFKNKIKEMGGNDVKLVIQKDLTTTDLSSQQNRLSIPPKQILNDFLSEEEKEKLDRMEWIGVQMIEPCLRVTEVRLKKWELRKNFSYNLINAWHRKVVQRAENGLRVGLMVQLYSFRLEDNQLCFALVKLD